MRMNREKIYPKEQFPLDEFVKVMNNIEGTTPLFRHEPTIVKTYGSYTQKEMGDNFKVIDAPDYEEYWGD